MLALKRVYFRVILLYLISIMEMEASINLFFALLILEETVFVLFCFFIHMTIVGKSALSMPNAVA